MVTCHFGQVVSVTSSIVKDPMKCSNEVVNNLNDVILYSLTNGILQTKILFTMQRLHYEGKSPQYPSDVGVSFYVLHSLVIKETAWPDRSEHRKVGKTEQNAGRKKAVRQLP